MWRLQGNSQVFRGGEAGKVLWPVLLLSLVAAFAYRNDYWACGEFEVV